MVQILKTVDLEDSEFVFDSLPNSENGRLGRFGRPAEPSAPKGRRFGRVWRDSRFHLQNSENEARVATVIGNLSLCCQVFIYLQRDYHFESYHSSANNTGIFWLSEK